MFIHQTLQGKGGRKKRKGEGKEMAEISFFYIRWNINIVLF